MGGHYLLRLLKIDDPTDASVVHGFVGIWGLWYFRTEIGNLETSDVVHLKAEFQGCMVDLFYDSLKYLTSVGNNKRLTLPPSAPNLTNLYREPVMST